MNQKKIIHLITTIEFGGAEKQLLILARNQIKQGLEVEVFYLKGKPELKKQFEDVGVKVNSLLVDQPFIFQVTKFRKFIRSNKSPVHTHLPQAELVASLACKKKKFIISRHNFEQTEKNVIDTIEMSEKPHHGDDVKLYFGKGEGRGKGEGKGEG